MFWFAGALTIIWGVALLFVLPPDPIRARGFGERERYMLVARLRTNNSGVRNKHYKLDQVRELAVDLKFWLVFAIAFLCMIANGPISTFVPIIINGFGFSTLHSLLLTMPAGAYAGTLMLVFPYLAMRYPGIRTWLILAAQLGTTLAALLLWVLPLNARGGLLFAAYILPSVGGGYAVLMSLQIANTAGYTKRSIASSGLYIGYCLGNFVGPLVFKKADAPRYVPGFIVVVVTSLAAGFLAVVYRYVCVWDNRRRDKTGITEGFDHAYEDDLTDIKVRSEYSLLFRQSPANNRKEPPIPLYSLTLPVVFLLVVALTASKRGGVMDYACIVVVVGQKKSTHSRRCYLEASNPPYMVIMQKIFRARTRDNGRLPSSPASILCRVAPPWPSGRPLLH